MELSKIMALDGEYVAKTYARYPVAFEGGKGATLIGTDGKEYIDFGAGIAVNAFGAGDEEWKRAVIAQLDRIQHVSNYYYQEPQAKLAELLCKKTGASRVFFGNSGAEANECAFKAARKYAAVKYGEGRKRILSLEGSFHGRTLFTLTATGQEEFHRDFGPFVPEVASFPPTEEGLNKALDERVAAIIIECVQGEGGVNELSLPFTRALARECEKRDILLICDEVQSGNGRTGKYFAYEHYGLHPDLVTTAKGLAGGLPIGACLFFGKTADVFSAGDHGSTFGGNPVSCAAAVNIVSRIDEALLLEVRAKADYLRTKLAQFDGVKGVSGIGLMIGLSVEKNSKEVARQCLERGLLVLTAHDKLRLVPPLTITKLEMDEGLSILKEVLK